MQVTMIIVFWIVAGFFQFVRIYRSGFSTFYGEYGDYLGLILCLFLWPLYEVVDMIAFVDWSHMTFVNFMKWIIEERGGDNG